MQSTFESVFGEDVFSGGEAPNDGADSCGVAGSGAIVLRVNNVFNVRSSAPASGKWITHASTITAVDFKVSVQGVVSAAAQTWMLRRYGSLGDDPNPDNTATALSRSGGGTAYLASATTNYRTTGLKTDSFNAAGIADCQDRVTTEGTVWAIATQQTDETTGAGSHFMAFDEYTNATAANRPQIVVTYKALRDPIMCGGMCPGRRL